jgi:DNA-directed RNA polymerase subunit beta
MQTKEIRDFSKRGDALPIPNLIDVQIESYQRFLQKEVEPGKRKNEGLEALLREVFPIESYDGNLRLEYISYDLSEPRYTTDECRALRLTYGMPFRIQVRFVRKDKDEVVEDSIYLGEIPIMIGGGEFIINGAERVIVNQLTARRAWTSWSKCRKATARCTAAASFPSAVVDRVLGHEEGRAGRPHRPVEQDPRDDVPAGAGQEVLSQRSDHHGVLPGRERQGRPLQAAYYAASPIIDSESGEELVKAGAQIGEAINKIQASNLKSSTA